MDTINLYISPVGNDRHDGLSPYEMVDIFVSPMFGNAMKITTDYRFRFPASPIGLTFRQL